MKKSTSCFAIFGLSIGLIACALLAGLIGIEIPRRTERTFGQPAADLGFQRRIMLSLRLISQADQLTSPLNPEAGNQLFTVKAGESAQDVALRLEDEGLIFSGTAMVDYMVYSGLDRAVQSGEYKLSARMPPLEIAHELLDASPEEVAFRILAGWRLEEIASALPTSGLTFDPVDFIAAAKAPTLDQSRLLGLPEDASLEGFLFPQRYIFPRRTTLDEFLATITGAIQSQLDPDLQAAFQKQGLNVFQAITLASIVQREAMVDDEMPLIASVFYNRLFIGMRIDSDPTVQYALGWSQDQGGWWKNPLDLNDLQTQSPYNTYQNYGLPPGPICSPGRAALEAVAYPAETGYYYFRATCDGSGRHNFAVTFDEHKANGCP